MVNISSEHVDVEIALLHNMCNDHNRYNIEAPLFDIKYKRAGA